MSDQYDLFGGFPPHQRHSPTSVRAAADIRDSINRLQARVLAEIKLAPGTDEELIDRTGMAANTFRPRRIELVMKGLIEESNEQRRTRSNRWAQVWRISSTNGR
jgi:transcription initiation factor IIE alpha subunit